MAVSLMTPMLARYCFFRILQEFGLTPGDLRALFALDGDHPRPMRTLAQAWGCDASNATWMVDRLETRGLVERRMLPPDRRAPGRYDWRPHPPDRGNRSVHQP
jgi:DNA-binding MarR family transcriptional regulator